MVVSLARPPDSLFRSGFSTVFGTSAQQCSTVLTAFEKYQPAKTIVVTGDLQPSKSQEPHSMLYVDSMALST